MPKKINCITIIIIFSLTLHSNTRFVTPNSLTKDMQNSGSAKQCSSLRHEKDKKKLTEDDAAGNDIYIYIYIFFFFGRS